jgi:uncharacterized protein (TIGR02453 family)
MGNFTGFGPKALPFFEALKFHQSREWFEENRGLYETDVLAPMVALIDDLTAAFAARKMPLRGDGKRSIFRLNRDVRFSKDKSPYKTAAGAVAEGEGGTRFYVEISSAGLRVAAGYYHLAPDQLERWRAAVADDGSGPALAAAVAEVRDRGLDVGARESLVRAPRGYPKDHPRIDLLRLKGCHAGRTFPPRRWLATKAALDRITGTWREAEPLTRLLDLHVGPSHLPPDELR